MQSDNRLIVALDVDSMAKAKEIVKQLGDTVSFYKVGMELFYSAGMGVIEFLKNQEKDVFLDLKLHDIPNTVAKSASVLTELGVNMMNVHASGGMAMMQAAAEAVGNKSAQLGTVKPLLIAVTVLTSMNDSEWQNLHYGNHIEEQVLHLAKCVKTAGLDGVVASPKEAALIRLACGDQFSIVTPGIRPSGSSVNDQSRIATPYDALKAGASHLVVGRPITAATDPQTAVQRIIEEMRGIA